MKTIMNTQIGNFFSTQFLANNQQVFVVLLTCFLTHSLPAQTPDTLPSWQYQPVPTWWDSTKVELSKYNQWRTEAGLPPIDVTNVHVTPDTMIWMYHEVPLPEEGEDEMKYTFWMKLKHKMKSLFGKKEAAPLQLENLTGTTITGFNFLTEAQTSGRFHIPPDPSGAVGTTHVCHVVNTAIQCHTKSGATITGFPQSMETFFSDLSPENGSFDPKIIWDQYENRFIAITLIRTAISEDDPADISRILVAVSETADPTGNWHTQAINVSQEIDNNDCWFDYPGLAVDDKAIYITGNYFRYNDRASCQAAMVVIIDKGVSGGIYDGVTSTDENPTTNNNFAIFRPTAEATNANGFDMTLQPAHTYGTPPSGLGTWLVGYNGLAAGDDEFLQVFRVANPLSANPTFTLQFIDIGDNDNTTIVMANTPQSGAATDIETNDRRTLNAVWRDDKLWVTTTVMPSRGVNVGQSTAFWVKLNAPGTGASVDLKGEVGGEDISTGAFTFFPSIAVNSSGNAAMVYSACNASMFVGSFAVGIDGATGTTGTIETILDGTDDYVRTFGGADNRWGDYSRMAVDPVSDVFWAFGQASIANGTELNGESGQWQIIIKELDNLDFPLNTINLPAGEQVTITAPRPNPFTKQTQFTLTPTTTQEIKIQIFNVGGQLVKTLPTQEVLAHQSHAFTVNNQSMTNGLYIIKIIGRNFTKQFKIMLNR